MNLELSDKVFLISGGAKGIGAGIVKSLAAEGAIPLAVGRSPDVARELVNEIRANGGKADAYALEMSDEPAVRQTVRSILDAYGRIDGVVNNAGRNDAVGLRHGVREFEASLKSNLVQVFSLTHHCLDALIESKGTIINIGSKCSVTGQGGTSGYAASKGGMNALTREWALDLARHGIRVNCVIPAEVITPLYEAWLEKAPDPEEARRPTGRDHPARASHHDNRGGRRHGRVPRITPLLPYHRTDSPRRRRLRPLRPGLHDGHESPPVVLTADGSASGGCRAKSPPL